jgi:predicted CoA-substrate-specific enzyme activase
MYTMGLDVGSTTSKCVILLDGKKIAGSSIVSAGTGTKGPDRAREEALAAAGIEQKDIAFLMATGYGRNNVSCADAQMSELSCHAAGVAAQFPEAKTIIDIGGQDAKAIHIGKGGKIGRFLMNDKCAAGTGRFLSVMATVLDVNISELEKLDELSKNRIEISSTCTVFAESEVISYLSDNVAKEDIIAAIHRSVATRVGSLVMRLGVEDDVVMTGGVAQNAGVVRALEKEIGTKINVSPIAQLNGAYGAALFAFEKCGEE